MRIGLRMTEEGGGGIIVRMLTLIQRFFDQNYSLLDNGESSLSDLTLLHGNVILFDTKNVCTSSKMVLPL